MPSIHPCPLSSAATAHLFAGVVWIDVVDYGWMGGAGKPSIGVCLDGDPTDAGSTMTVEHIPRAWKIHADRDYPKTVPADKIKVLLDPSRSF